MVYDEQFTSAKILFRHSRGALCIGKDKAATDHANAFGKFAALPPAIEQSGNTTCHDNSHISDNPVGRIARGDPNAVPFLEPVTIDQSTRQCACRTISFCET